MQMQAIKQNDDENHAIRSDMQGKAKAKAENSAMQAICKGKRKQGRQSLIYMHEKADYENDACNANDKAMNAMQ